MIKSGEDRNFKFFTRMADMKGKGLKKTFIVNRQKSSEFQKRISINPNLFLKNEEFVKTLKSKSRTDHFMIENLQLDEVNDILEDNDEEKIETNLVKDTEFTDLLENEEEVENDPFGDFNDSIIEESDEESESEEDAEEGKISSKKKSEKRKVKLGLFLS